MAAPLVQIERLNNRAFVMFVPPDSKRLYPFDYGGFRGLGRFYINSRSDSSRFREDSILSATVDYYVLYSSTSQGLRGYLDFLELCVGPLEPVFHAGPSTLDFLLHILNPRHNSTHEAWVYRRQTAPASGPSPSTENAG